MPKRLLVGVLSMALALSTMASSCGVLTAQFDTSFVGLHNNGIPSGVPESDISKATCTIYVSVKQKSNTDLSSYYDVNLKVKDQVYSEKHVKISNPDNTIDVTVPTSAIIDLLTELNNTIANQKDKATAAYNDFENRMKYKLAQQWTSGGAFPKYSYDEMQGLIRQEQELRDAMENPKVDYDSICRKYATITIEKSTLQNSTTANPSTASPQSITIISPNGGEIWYIGDVVTNKLPTTLRSGY